MKRLFAVAGTLALLSVAHGAPIYFAAKTIDPSAKPVKKRGVGGILGSSRLPERGVYVIQHDGAITAEWRDELSNAGALVRDYIPDDAYLIEASPEAYQKIADNIDYTYLGQYEAAWRQAADIGAGDIECEILLFDESNRQAVEDKINSLSGCRVTASSGIVIRAILSADAIEEISALPDVHWIERYIAPKLCNNVAVQAGMMNVETVWPGGASSLGLTGKGQIVAVADSGLDTGSMSTVHEDVRGRILAAYSIGRMDYDGHWDDQGGHGTHTVGSVLGNGAKSDGKFRGPAYEASLVFQSLAAPKKDWSQDEYGNWHYSLYTFSDLYTQFNQAYTNQNGRAGARIHSNSWGHTEESGVNVMGCYRNQSVGIDRFMFENPDMLIIFSAGNNAVDANKDGVVDLDSIGVPGTAKNCLTVGASENYRTSGGYSTYPWGFGADPVKSDYISRPYDGTHQGIAGFSSRGPCKDGRIKPEIVAPGTDIISMSSSVGDVDTWGIYDSYYRYMGGTSMSTPLVAGTAALVRQWLQEKRSIANPDGATIKAVLLAGAKSLAPGQYGTGKYREIPASYPNNVEGWGQADIGNAIANDSGILVYDAKVIEEGVTDTYRIKATAGKPLAIILAYTDAPGSPAAAQTAPKLVNDLDLLVIAPDGTTKHYPNSLNTPDRINNVEGVRLAASDVVDGIYTVTVSGYKITTAMLQTLTGKASAVRYSLVVNGAEEPSSDPVAAPKADLAFTTYGSWPAAALLSKSSSSTTAATTFEEGESIYLYAYFRNVGEAASGDFTVSHKVVNASTGAVVAQQELAVESREVGQGGGWNAADVPVLQGLVAGTYRWECELDSAGVVDESDESNNTISLTFTVTKKSVTVPGAPVSLTATPGSNSIVVSWNSVSGAESYNIYRSTSSARPSSPLATVSGVSAYSDGSVQIGTTYNYWVGAVNSEGVEGAISGPVSGQIAVSLTLDNYDTRSFEAPGGSDSVTVNANVAWTATANKSWVSLSPSGGSSGRTLLTFYVDATDVLEGRAATITISATDGSASRTIAVTQSGITANPALASAVGNCSLSFWTGGAADWVVTSTEDTFATAGSYVRTTALAQGDSSWLETKVSGSGVLQFRYSLSASASGGLQLFIDDAKITTLYTPSGTWKYYTYTISSSGTHTVRWVYTQNFGSVYAMIDDVSFGAGAPPRLPDSYSAESGYEGVKISWSCYDTSSVSSFKVYRATNLSGAGRQLIATVAPSGSTSYPKLSYTDTTGVLGVTYYYWVEAINSYGSTISDAAAAQKESATVTLDAYELALSAVVPDNGQIKIGYDANIDFYAWSKADWIVFTWTPSKCWAAEHFYTMNFTVSANTNESSRIGEVVITSDEDGLEVIGTLTVVQEGMPRNPVPLTWYVDAAAGDDENDGSSPDSAKKTIQAAIDVALSGDSIIVADGTYSEKIEFGKKDLSIRSVNGAKKTILQHPKVEASGPVVYSFDRSNTLEGFYIDGRGCYNWHGNCVRGGTLVGCVVTGGKGGSRGGGVNGAALVNCIVTGNSSSTGGGTYGCALTNCTVYGNCASSSGGGAYAGTCCNSIIWGNTNALGEVSNYYDYNGISYIYTCTEPLIAGSGNIAEDPQIVWSDGMYTLSAASPCLNAGLNSGARGDKDLVGNPRIGNARVDMGAIEDLTIAPTAPECTAKAAQTAVIEIEIASSPRATEYLVYRSTSASARPSQPHAILPASDEDHMTYVDTEDVTSGDVYWYWVAARNEAGTSTVKSAGKTWRIPTLSVTPDGETIEFDGDGGYAELAVTSDSTWAVVADDDWVNVTPSGGIADGIVALSAGTGAKTERETRVRIIAAFGTANEVEVEVAVAQQARPPETFKVTFYRNGGSGTMASQRFTEGISATLSPCAYSRTGYVFAGWALSAGGEAFYADEQQIAPSRDISLYACWTPIRYAVLFEANDGSSKTRTQQFVYDSESALETNVFSRRGWAFRGWANEADGDASYYDGEKVKNLSTEDGGVVILYAVWNALAAPSPVPQSISASAASIVLTFSTSDNATSYRIYRAEGDAGEIEAYDELAHTSEMGATCVWVDGAAVPGVEYRYYVSAVAPLGESGTAYFGTAFRMAEISATPEAISFNTEGGTVEIEVAANADWTISPSDGWILAESKTKVESEREWQCLVVTVGTSMSVRGGNIVLNAAAGTAHPAFCTIAVTQSGSSSSLPEVAEDADAATVDEAVAAAGFVDSRVSALIGSSATEYRAFKSWASSLPEGEAAVVASPNAAPAFLLGAEKLFSQPPQLVFDQLDVATDSGDVSLSVCVKDGDDPVKVASDKVRQLFQATRDVADWAGEGTKLEPTIRECVEMPDKTLRFTVRPGDGTEPAAFIRISR